MRRQMRRLNAQFDFLGDPADVLIHPDDGAAAGVVDGRPVTVRSAHGELTRVAKVDPAIRRGGVSVPHGHVEANVNVLTNKDDIDLVTGMVRYSGCAGQPAPRLSIRIAVAGVRLGDLVWPDGK
jgi:anaerobic selenocysteine-containing dehydrogenase